MAGVELSLLEAALGGNRRSLRELVDEMAPVVRARAARVLAKHPATNTRSELEDLCQEIFVGLFTKDAQTLRSWDPEKGLSFLNFVGLVAERRALTIRAKRDYLNNASSEDPQSAGVGAFALEEPVVSRQLLGRLLEDLEATLSPKGYEMFLRLYVNEENPSEIGRRLGLSQNAIHKWRSRLGSVARQALTELTEPGPKGSAPEIRSHSTERERASQQPRQAEGRVTERG